MFPIRTPIIWIVASSQFLFANQISASCPRCVKIEKEREQEQKKNPAILPYYGEQVEKEQPTNIEETPKFLFKEDPQDQASSRFLSDASNSAQDPLSSERSSLFSQLVAQKNAFVSEDEKQAKSNSTSANKQNASMVAHPPIFSSTLCNVLKTKDFLETLDGSFSLFIPTDEALQALPPGTLKDLLKPENKEKLAILISNHIIPKKLLKNEFIRLDNKEIKTLSGRNLTLHVKNGNLRVEDAHVISIEPAGYDGVIYIIDKVLE